MSKSNKKNILILMSGSIACYKICSLISKLVQNDINVKVAMSVSAQKFIGTATIEGLSQNSVHTDTFEAGRAMEHIHLDRWADLILLAPASANTINKIAHGYGEDLISTLFLAHDFQKPFLVAPAMNTKMYLHPTTQKSITALKSMNVEILEAASGVLACGEVGYGRLLEPDLLFNEILSHLEKTRSTPARDLKSTKLPKILITSGGTQEPIDDVRVITNKSTGNTAATLADDFISAGFDVTYLCAKSASRPTLEATIETFVTYKDLDHQLTRQLQNKYDVIIHAAAVSDYSVAQPTSGKINSSSESLQINLIKNPKLIDKIKKLSPQSKLVGFKLTSGLTEQETTEKINSLFKNAHCDYVVHNDWSTVHSGQHHFNLYTNGDTLKGLMLFDLSHALMESFISKESL